MLDIELQKLIYGEHSRLDLLDYKTKSERKVKIAVYRNHSFELVEHTIHPFLDYAGINAEFSYSDYDDSLTFLNLDLTSDLLILWLDASRYQNDNLESFFEDRINYLLTIYNKPIIVCLLGNLVMKNDKVLCFNFEKIKGELQDNYLDLKKEKFTGTRLSSKALLKFSFDLGLNYIPYLINTRIKAIALDLDNTLYGGILAEDGIEGLSFTPEYQKLQEKLIDLKNQGFMLCIVSKNEESDVIKLLQSGKIKFCEGDFSAIMASWNSKSTSIQNAAKKMNIGLDSVLFVDDNFGELAEVESNIPQVKKILANENPLETLMILENYPGLRKFNLQKEDALRTADVNANEKRKELQSNLSQKEYLKTLDTKLDFCINCSAFYNRISELANKTNQFIFNYKRYNLQQVESYSVKGKSCIISVHLRDKLSDSGLIGAFFAHKEDTILYLDECFISCRALGRTLEELIAKVSIKNLIEELSCNELFICFKDGERNKPARVFLEKYFSEFINNAKSWKHEFSYDDSVNISIKKGDY